MSKPAISFSVKRDNRSLTVRLDSDRLDEAVEGDAVSCSRVLSRLTRALETMPTTMPETFSCTNHLAVSLGVELHLLKKQQCEEWLVKCGGGTSSNSGDRFQQASAAVATILKMDKSDELESWLDDASKCPPTALQPLILYALSGDKHDLPAGEKQTAEHHRLRAMTKHTAALLKRDLTKRYLSVKDGFESLQELSAEKTQ